MLHQCALLVLGIVLLAVMSDVTAVCCLGVMDSFSGCVELCYSNVNYLCDEYL